MINRTIAGTILALWFTGCSDNIPRQQYDVVIDSQMSPSDAANVEWALAQWTDKTGVVFNIRVADNVWTAYTNDTIGITTTTEAEIVSNCSMKPVPGYEILACTVPTGNSSSNVLLQPNFDPRFVLHELGHALGLVHTLKGDVMYFCADCPGQPYTLTPDDINQYQTIRRIE